MAEKKLSISANEGLKCIASQVTIRSLRLFDGRWFWNLLVCLLARAPLMEIFAPASAGDLTFSVSQMHPFARPARGKRLVV